VRPRPGRSKETATDYRYFPEPDLAPLEPDPAWVEQLRASLPELPREHRRRLQEAWGMGDREMQAAVNAGAVELIEATVAAGSSPEGARKWWLGELARRANEQGIELAAVGATPSHVAELQALVEAGPSTTRSPVRSSRALSPARALRAR
jgi:aspartyl-tRNA(Asn)/glutamyl-tRNA(Gln) amidotransferase subunit B